MNNLRWGSLWNFGETKVRQHNQDISNKEPAPCDRLILPLSLEDGRQPKIFSHVLYVISFFLFAAIVWASVAEVREVAHAQGEIAPLGSVHTVQHLEGGIVSEILVKEGDLVQVSQPLFKLQPAGPSSELGQIETRLARLKLEEMRLHAESEGEMPDFGIVGRKYPALSANQLIQFRANMKTRLKEEAVLKARVNQKRTDIESANREYVAIYEQLAAEEEKLNIQKVLLKDGYTSKQLYLNAKASYHRVLSEKIALQNKLRAARQTLKEAEANLIKARADAAGQIAADLARVSGEKAEAEQQIGKLKDRVQRLYIRASVAGAMKQIVPKSAGAVVRPGEMLAEIVPTGQELVAEVHIKHKDIGHVKPGDKADIKVTTFDPNRYGSLHGEVRKISASSFKDDQGEPYFKATLAIDESDLSQDTGKLSLSAGMVVNAEIITATKSLTRYLLKPIYRSIDTAFTER